MCLKQYSTKVSPAQLLFGSVPFTDNRQVNFLGKSVSDRGDLARFSAREHYCHVILITIVVNPFNCRRVHCYERFTSAIKL